MSASSKLPLESWIDPAARVGFLARGFVYVVIGLLAADRAIGLGFGGRATDADGAIRAMGRIPLGPVLLVVVAVGLAAYAAWRFVEAVFDPERQGWGWGWKGLVARGVSVGSGLFHAWLAATAAALAAGQSRAKEDQVRKWTSWVLTDPRGRWVVAAAGLVVIGVAVGQLYNAWAYKFEEKLRTRRMSDGERRWARRIGRAGLATRGVTFALIGWFLLVAATKSDPSQARNVAGVLKALIHQESGPWLLGAVAVGLVAYGLLSVVEARYRRMTD